MPAVATLAIFPEWGPQRAARDHAGAIQQESRFPQPQATTCLQLGSISSPAVPEPTPRTNPPNRPDLQDGQEILQTNHPLSPCLTLAATAGSRAIPHRGEHANIPAPVASRVETLVPKPDRPGAARPP